jgi:ribokinase
MIVVFGSINLDLVTRVERFPRPGETVAGTSFGTFAGGKGANQALAAALAGATVRLYGAVGRDAFADPAFAALAAGKVDLSGVACADAPTGCATILVDERGENCIAVVAGANALADPATVPSSALGPQSLLILQHEVPAAANVALLERARRVGARTLLNAAPARALSRDALDLLDVLVVNEDEAAMLASAFGWPREPERFARAASAAHALSTVVTLGARGVLAANDAAIWRASAPEVRVVDTTGAGDAFVGAFAAALDRRAEFGDALQRGVAAGSLACTKPGAQTALPDRAAIETASRTVTVKRGASW